MWYNQLKDRLTLQVKKQNEIKCVKYLSSFLSRFSNDAASIKIFLQEPLRETKGKLDTFIQVLDLFLLLFEMSIFCFSCERK